MNVNFKVLVVEDEADILEVISSALTSHGHNVLGVMDSTEALESIEKFQPDILIIDNVMPKISGNELVQQIRADERNRYLPIVMVTGMDTEAEMLEAFRFGVDDYVTKPFSPAELLARVAAVVRRGRALPTVSKSTVANGEIEIDFPGHRVHCRGKDVALTLTEFKLLSELVQNSGQVLSRDQLRGSVLGGSNVTGRTVDVHVASLRRKLGDAGRMVTTIRGVGYKLTA